MKRTILLMGLTLNLLGASSVMATLKCPTPEEFNIERYMPWVNIKGERHIGDVIVFWNENVHDSDHPYSHDKVVTVTTMDNFNCRVKMHPDNGEDYELEIPIKAIENIAPPANELAIYIEGIIDDLSMGKNPSVNFNGYTWKLYHHSGPLLKDVPLTPRDPDGGRYTLFSRVSDDSGYALASYDSYYPNGKRLQLSFKALVELNKL